MNVPPAMREAIATLRTERQRVSSELDSIDLALSNLCRLYEPRAAASGQIAPAAPTTRKYTRRSKPGKRAKTAKPQPVVTTGDASARRQQLLELIGKSEVGLTVADLRKATPKMEGQDRSNALQSLKTHGEILRKGNAWVKA